MHGIFMYIFSFLVLCFTKFFFGCGRPERNYFVKFRNVKIHTKSREIFNRKMIKSCPQTIEDSQQKNTCANFDISSGQFF